MNKRIWLVILSGLLIVVAGCGSRSHHGPSSIPQISWQKVYGGTSYEYANSIQQTSDGGYIVAGFSASTDIFGLTNQGKTDCYIIKMDADGIRTGEKMYGGNGDDYANSIQQTSDGGYIVAGYSDSTNIPGLTNHGKKDCFIMKLDESGGIVWQKMYGGNNDDSASSIQPTSDGGYIMAGYSTSTDILGLTNHGSADYLIIKLDGTGNIVWQKMYGGNGAEFGSSILQTGDGGYVVAGSSSSTDIAGLTNHGISDYHMIKLDGDGNLAWQKLYGGNYDESPNSIQQTSDGGYILAGYSNSTDISGLTNHGLMDYYIVKTDEAGNSMWEKMYGGNATDNAYSIQPTSDGGYIVAGPSLSTDIPRLTNCGQLDVYVIQLDNAGNIAWQKMFGGSGSDVAYSIQPTSDGGYIVAGSSASTDISGVTNHGSGDYYIVKLK
ncbi:MAG TPA: hypothetical protein VHY08_21485 [Bacillota bacterium]|nr:hypothetical protein [Bacillota bacterium]